MRLHSRRLALALPVLKRLVHRAVPSQVEQHLLLNTAIHADAANQIVILNPFDDLRSDEHAVDDKVVPNEESIVSHDSEELAPMV